MNRKLYITYQAKTLFTGAEPPIQAIVVDVCEPTLNAMKLAVCGKVSDVEPHQVFIVGAIIIHTDE